jgi:hypothetical protein
MATRFHKPLKVITFNANCIGRQHYELSEHPQYLHVDVTLFSEIHPQPLERNFISIPLLSNRPPPRQKRRNWHCMPHNHVDLPPLVSVEATGVGLPIGNSEVLLASVYKSPGRDFLSFRFCQMICSAVSSPSCEKLMALFDVNEFEISSSQCPTHYSSAGNGDVIDIVVHQNISVRCHCLIFWTQITYQYYSTYRIMPN